MKSPAIRGRQRRSGPDAAWRVAVYFETEDDANAFADVMQPGLLGHEADPVIAHVTTYCLD